MRNIILNVAVSLDGYIEGPQGEYDWCFADQDYGLSELLQRVDALVMGRKTYEVLQAQEDYTFPQVKKYVFSRTLHTAPEDVTLVSGDVKEAIAAIKNEPGKDIWLFGGADLTASLLNEGLVDELMLAVHPILLGGGKLLFSGIHNRLPLQLQDSKAYSTGLVSLVYTIAQR